MKRMKVILTAFSEKFRSKVMDFPDASKDEITLALPFENFQITVKDNESIGFPKEARGRFISTGQSILDGEEFLTIYRLVELSGCDCVLVRSLKEQVDELEEEIELRDGEDKRRSINSLTDADFGR